MSSWPKYEVFAQTLCHKSFPYGTLSLLSWIFSVLFGFKFKKWMISFRQVISLKFDMISHAILKYILDFKPQSIEKIWFGLWSLPNVYYPAINLLSIYLYSVSDMTLINKVDLFSSLFTCQICHQLAVGLCQYSVARFSCFQTPHCLWIVLQLTFC